MENILIDAGPLIALFSKRDNYHKRAVQFVKENKLIYWTTWPVVTEACHMLDFSIKAQTNLLEWCDRGGIFFVDLNQNHLKRLIELSLKYSDVPMDLADASIIVASELKGIKKIATIDTDFYIYRDVRKNFLTNVFL
ncbi:PIN domain-containing protein [Aquiflexum sp. TKW24L]|uniref:type II toxin-antitoxin system VapC family toxin n=1 Tax=Aquiflexum sp. TKW24L TaxID=2942212 RepID=UPI0020C15F06|nr:PIN domain-containing protein [Aquiflexum sp. TKW24L]MCL6261036.1 PIN domain-containing protein [Aquiflexum sp. TKW24L]